MEGEALPMDGILSHLTFNTRPFQELGRRQKVILSQLPLSLTVLLVVVVGALFHPELFGSTVFLLGLGTHALLLVLCIGVPWDRLPSAAFLAIPILDFLPIGLLRYGADVTITGVGLLTVFPVIWLAASGLYPRALLLVSLLASLGIVWGPVFAAGEAWSAQSLTQSILLPFMMVVIGVTVRSITANLTAQRWMLEDKDRAVQSLLKQSARRERLLSAVVDSVDVGLIAMDEAGRPVLSNRRLQQFQELAAGSSDAAEEDLRIFGQDGRTQLAVTHRPLRRAAEGQIFSDYLLWWGEQPQQRILSTSSRLLTNQAGGREGSVVTFNDVTELVAALNAKDEFVTTVSHELRTPLTAITGYLDLLTSIPDLEEDVASGLEVISRNSERLHRLVVDLLSAAEASPEIHPTPTDVTALVRERVAVARSRDANPLVEFEEEITPGMEVVCDGARISQVVDNLLSNAVKYSPEGGRVVVRAGFSGDGVECSVEDHGSGMSDEEVDGVFSKFFRTSAARNAAIPGVGLGLAIAKGIVEQHGGGIRCRSVEGRGSTFTFSLPDVVGVRA